MSALSCGVPRDVEANGLRLQVHEWQGEPQPEARRAETGMGPSGARQGEPQPEARRADTGMGPSGARQRAAPPALLLHSQAAHSHWWDWTAPLLAEQFHPVALDLRGHGGSQWAEPAAYRFVDYAEDVVAVLDALGWQSPLVIGHSMGGYVGAYLASLHPRRVGALVIVDTLAEWEPDTERWAARQAERPGPEFASREEAGARFRLTPPETRAPAEWLRHLGEAGVAERRAGVWQHAFDRRLFRHPRPNAWPFLPGVVCPTLVVRGEGSHIMDRETWLKVTTAVQRGQFAEIKGAFHHLILDDPPQFVSTVTRWLASVGRAEGP